MSKSIFQLIVLPHLARISRAPAHSAQSCRSSLLGLSSSNRYDQHPSRARARCFGSSSRKGKAPAHAYAYEDAEYDIADPSSSTRAGLSYRSPTRQVVDPEWPGEWSGTRDMGMNEIHWNGHDPPSLHLEIDEGIGSSRRDIAFDVIESDYRHTEVAVGRVGAERRTKSDGSGLILETKSEGRRGNEARSGKARDMNGPDMAIANTGKTDSSTDTSALSSSSTPPRPKSVPRSRRSRKDVLFEALDRVEQGHSSFPLGAFPNHPTHTSNYPKPTHSRLSLHQPNIEVSGTTSTSPKPSLQSKASRIIPLELDSTLR